MVDYEQMYYKMNRAMEKAIDILVQAQRECEEDYLTQTDPPEEQTAAANDNKTPD